MRVLLVENLQIASEPLTNLMKRQGFEVALVTTLQDAQLTLENSREDFRAVIIGIQLSDDEYISFSSIAQVPIVITTTLMTKSWCSMIESNLKGQKIRILGKPFRFSELEKSLEDILTE